jgi:hypothetical protein
MKKNRTPLRAVTLCMLAFATLLGFDAFLAFAQTQSPSKDAKTYAELTKVPGKARARRNPLEPMDKITRPRISDFRKFTFPFARSIVFWIFRSRFSACLHIRLGVHHDDTDL